MSPEYGPCLPKQDVPKYRVSHWDPHPLIMFAERGGLLHHYCCLTSVQNIILFFSG